MKEVPQKNIDTVVTDIKKPNFNYSRISRLETITVSHVKKTWQSNKSHKITWLVGGGVTSVFCLLIAFTLWGLYDMKKTAEVKGEIIYNNFFASIESLKSFEPEMAAKLLTENDKELKSLEKNIKTPPREILVGGLSDTVPVFKDSIKLLGGLTDFNLNLLYLVRTVDELKNHGFSYFKTDGPALVKKLRDLKDTVVKLQKEIVDIKNAASKIGNQSSFFKKVSKSIDEKYVKYASNLYVAEDGLTSLINLLDSKVDQHILILFNNVGELRPGGGFIGSYGDLVVNDGQMASLEVQNIYWPDRPFNLALKIVPPEPLQTITEDWGARDSNWFFDFPTSAKTTVSFLEASKIYSEKNIKFENVIALNTNVFKSLLDVVGPIEVSDYKMTINSENFLDEIQREVEAGKDKKAGDNPKKVLGVIAPILIDKLGNLSDAGKKMLAEKLEYHLNKKDLMLYSRNQGLAKAFKTTGIDGAVMETPNSFWGSYLAVVNGNVAGGKTDVLTTQKIEGQIDVDTDGGSFVTLDLTRTNNGGGRPDWWWNSDNQNYLQFFTNLNSKIISLSGNTIKTRKKSLSYDSLGYQRNPDLEALEKTSIALTGLNAWSLEAWGKSVFATWFTVPAGKSKTLTLKYEIPGIKDFTVSPERNYQFIFERQSGSPTSLKIQFNAPFGYVWQESKSPVYVFNTDDPDKKEIIDIHLEPVPKT